MTREDRFWAKVWRDEDTGCWLWLASKYPSGYGQVGWSHNGVKKVVGAHRVAYESLVGSIPEGLHIDHLCRNRACVNPSHMEVVSPGENVLRGVGPSAANARKTHCKRGHEFAVHAVLRQRGDRRVMRKCSLCEKERERRRDRPTTRAGREAQAKKRRAA